MVRTPRTERGQRCQRATLLCSLKPTDCLLACMHAPCAKQWEPRASRACVPSNRIPCPWPCTSARRARTQPYVYALLHAVSELLCRACDARRSQPHRPPSLPPSLPPSPPSLPPTARRPPSFSRGFGAGGQAGRMRQEGCGREGGRQAGRQTGRQNSYTVCLSTRALGSDGDSAGHGDSGSDSHGQQLISFVLDNLRLRTRQPQCQIAEPCNVYRSVRPSAWRRRRQSQKARLAVSRVLGATTAYCLAVVRQSHN